MRVVHELGNGSVGSLAPVGMSSDVVFDTLGVGLEGSVGSLAPVGMSSDVVFDTLGVGLEGSVGSLAPVGMSEVPVPVVALTKGKVMDRKKVIAGKKSIVTMTQVCKAECKITN